MKWHGRFAAVVGAVALSGSVGIAMFLGYGPASSADPPVPGTVSPTPSGVAPGPSQPAATSTPGLSLPGTGPLGTPSQSPQTTPRAGTPVVPSPDGTLLLGEVHLEGFVPPPPPAKRPPDNSVHIGSQYLKNYRATRVNWDDVIDQGRALPGVSGGCADRWRKSGKDSRLNWSSVDYMCMDGLNGRAYKPQGVGGSATTERYTIGTKPAADRNIVLTSWYSRVREPGLFADNHSGESVTRLVVMDMDQRRYNNVELVRTDGHGRLRNLDSHGSGLVWAGQYIYSSSHSVLWMYNADDILKINGHFVLPAVARWTVHGSGGLSSISLDRSVTPNQLKGINYTKNGQAYIQSFDLAENGLLAQNSRRTAHDMSVRNRFGDKGREVHSVSSLMIPGASYQGVGSAGAYSFANSSSLRTSRSAHKVDATAVFKNGKVIGRFQMPRGNGESIYIDYRRGIYRSITEGGSQFMYALPLEHLIERAER